MVPGITDMNLYSGIESFKYMYIITKVMNTGYIHIHVHANHFLMHKCKILKASSLHDCIVNLYIIRIL